MRKLIVAASAALFTTLAVAASSVPASAGGGVTFGFSGGHHDHGWSGHRGGSVTFGFDSGRRDHRRAWQRHVNWCFDHYASYDPDSNRFFNGHRWRQCRSPFI